MEKALQIYLSIRKAARLRLLRRQPPCREMVRLMSQSLERALGLRERLSLHLHLIVCAWCDLYLEQLRFLRQLIRLQNDCIDEEISPRHTLSLDARARIAHSIKNRNI